MKRLSLFILSLVLTCNTFSQFIITEDRKYYDVLGMGGIKSDLRNLTGEDYESVSRTIYVAPADSGGSDVTGLGTELAPYASYSKALSTIKRYIGSEVTITIHQKPGTLDLTANDLTYISQFQGAGTLTFEGEMLLVESGFTMGAAESDDPLTYAVSGGNTAEWTENEFQFYFLKSGTNYYPITANTSSTISLTRNVTGTEIYKINSFVNLNSNLRGLLNISFDFLQLEINNNILEKSTGLTQYSFNTCNFNASSAILFTMNYGSDFRFIKCSFNNIRLIFNTVCNQLQNIYMKHDINQSLILTDYKLSNNALISNLVLENPNTGSSSTCLSISSETYSGAWAANIYIKFVNSNVGILLRNNLNFTTVQQYDKYILVNTNYLLREKGAETYYPSIFKINYINIYGSPNISWFYDNMYEFVNPVSGRNIQITGLIYPEFENNLSATLTDNATTNVIVGDSIQNKTITINYTITRGTDQEMGVLRIINKKSGGVTIAEDTPIGDDVGVSWAVTFSSGEISLDATLTSTGTGATIYYDAKRVLYIPLTL